MSAQLRPASCLRTLSRRAPAKGLCRPSASSADSWSWTLWTAATSTALWRPQSAPGRSKPCGLNWTSGPSRRSTTRTKPAKAPGWESLPTADGWCLVAQCRVPSLREWVHASTPHMPGYLPISVQDKCFFQPSHFLSLKPNQNSVKCLIAASKFFRPVKNASNTFTFTFQKKMLSKYFSPSLSWIKPTGNPNNIPVNKNKPL